VFLSLRKTKRDEPIFLAWHKLKKILKR